MITRSDRLILEAFMGMKTPPDFDSGWDNIRFVDSLRGLVSRLLSEEKIPKMDEIKMYKPNSETKERLSRILSNSNENLIYYNLIKLCFLILERYSVN